MAINADKFKDIYKNRENLKDGFFKPKEGSNRIRILPPKSDKLELPYVMNVFHYQLPITDGDFSGVLCAKTYDIMSDKLKGNGNCPICDYVAKLYKAGDEDSKKLAGQIKARPTFYANIVDLSDKKLNPRDLKPLIYTFSKTVRVGIDSCFRVYVDKKGNLVNEEDLVDLDMDELELKVVDITNLKKGFNIQINKLAKSNNDSFIEYTVVRGKNASELIDGARIYKEAKTLEDYLLKPNIALLKKNMQALLNSDNDVKTVDEEFATEELKDDDISMDFDIKDSDENITELK